MDNNLYLIHDQSGIGVDFQVLDLIIVDDRLFLVLTAAAAEDAMILDTMMETAEQEDNCIDVCILEMTEDRDGRCSYIRVEPGLLEEVYEIFRKRNESRFQFQ